MASGRAQGTYSIYIENPSGERRLVKTSNAGYWNCANLGSPDGQISTSATPEKWSFLPLSNDAGSGGYKVVLIYTSSTATTLDASDAVAIIPIMVNNNMETIGNNGGAVGIGNDNFSSVVALADTAYVANQPTVAWSIKANEGVTFRVGGGPVFLSLENNS
jgi:hypothetical protein